MHCWYVFLEQWCLMEVSAMGLFIIKHWEDGPFMPSYIPLSITAGWTWCSNLSVEPVLMSEIPGALSYDLWCFNFLKTVFFHVIFGFSASYEILCDFWNYIKENVQLCQSKPLRLIHFIFGSETIMKNLYLVIKQGLPKIQQKKIKVYVVVEKL